MSDRVSNSVVPEDNITWATVAFYVDLLVEVDYVSFMRWLRFFYVLGMEIVIEGPVTARPDSKSTSSWSYVVNVAYNAQVKGVAVYVASGWAFGRVTFWENAVYAANSARNLQCIPT